MDRDLGHADLSNGFDLERHHDDQQLNREHVDRNHQLSTTSAYVVSATEAAVPATEAAVLSSEPVVPATEAAVLSSEPVALATEAAVLSSEAEVLATEAAVLSSEAVLATEAVLSSEEVAERLKPKSTAMAVVVAPVRAVEEVVAYARQLLKTMPHCLPSSRASSSRTLA